MAGIGIALRPSGDFVRSAFDIALELSHPIYDCLYLATALGMDDLLVTADQRFLPVAAAPATPDGWSRSPRLPPDAAAAYFSRS